VSVVLLWWVFRGEDIGAIAGLIAQADPLLLVAAGVVSTAGGLIRALRWRLLLEPLGVASSLDARWRSLNIGFMVTNVTWGRLGEIARPYALSRMAPVSASSALGTVVLERVLDAVALLLLLFVTLLSPGVPENATVMGRPIGYAVTGAAAAAGLALVLVVGLFFLPQAALRLAGVLAALVPGKLGDKLLAAFESFLAGLALLRQPRRLAVALLWSVALWVWMAGSFWLAFRAFDLTTSVTAALFTQCAVSVFVAIPAAPGFLGTMQAGVLVALSEVFGLPSESVLSLAVGYHLAGYIPVTLLGLYYAWALGLRVTSIETEAEHAFEAQGGTTEHEGGRS
jgi:uncharacterized protein (TIRG00374 family)